MATLRSPKKSPTGAPGARALITATSLAITLGGWAVFARASTEAADTASPPTAAVALPRPLASLDLSMQPLPTIVPLPQPPSLAIAQPPAAPADLLSGGVPAPVQAQAPQAPAPAAIQPPAAPPLRAVSAPPQPVARTRSSR